MGRKSLTRQVQEALTELLCVGQSKHDAKKKGTAQDGIYSWSTFRTYMKELNYFTHYCKQQHGCRTLDECKPFAAEWLQSRAGLSPYTQKLDAAALRKLYQGIELPETAARKRENISRSRSTASRDANFKPEHHQELIRFCRSTGLRRSELEHLRGSQLYLDDDGSAYLLIKGKGGRVREAPIVGAYEDVQAVINRCLSAGNDLVWGKVNTNADIHSYRADYCHTVYDLFARDLEQLSKNERYYCQGDRKGTIFDRRAMLEVSKALGHNRINVIASHYLR